MAIYTNTINGKWNKDNPQQGDTWQGGVYYNGGLGTVVPAGYIYSNGKWISPLSYKAEQLAAQKIGYETENLSLQNQIAQGYLQNQQAQNELAAKKFGYETENLGLQNQISQGQLQNQQLQNRVASTAGGRLNELLQNPSSISSDPGYQFQYNQGIEAVNRTNAARGMLNSGNRLYDLTNYGQDRGKTAYGDSISRLSGVLTGTSSNPYIQNQNGNAYLSNNNNKNNQYQTLPNGSISLGGSY